MNKNAYALLIGINQYQDETNLPPLQYPEKDCEDLYKILTDERIGNFPKENVTLLLGAEASTNNV
jgi:uncharacterized caspase-like protein